MSSTHSAASCRWATPTLFLAAPDWIDAWEYSWSCERHAAPRVLFTPEDCATCARWEARPEVAKPSPAPPSPNLQHVGGR